MANPERKRPPKRILDKDLDRIANVEEAAGLGGRSLVAPGLALLFVVVAAVLASTRVFDEPGAVSIVAAVVLAGYMALTIGANDVANNVGPAVGARVVSMGGALAVAAVFETLGAVLAGRPVVETIATGIVGEHSMIEPTDFIFLMLSALIASALWIHFSTWLRAPVSTTHAIVGAVVGGGVAAAGFSSIDWRSMAWITASWAVTPFLSGATAALMLAFVEARIVNRDDKIAAARRWVPMLTAAMSGAFLAYLGGIAAPHATGRHVAVLGIFAAAAVWIASHILVEAQSRGLANRNQSLRALFSWPLVGAAAILSFGHGANDVANAVGPLAALVNVVRGGGTGQAAVPFWVLLIGGLGISVGLLLFGPRLIRRVGAEITRLNPVRAFCIALSTAVVVILATSLGLPVSTTHIAVGAVFGIGFFREWAALRSDRKRSAVQGPSAQSDMPHAAIAAADIENPRAGGKKGSEPERVRRRLVRRAHVTAIAMAWMTTVPVSAALSAVVFKMLKVAF